MPTTSATDEIADHAVQLLNDKRSVIHQRTDRMFACLMILQWIAGIVVAVWISPQAWGEALGETHLHIWGAIVIGGAISLYPVGLAIFFPGATLTRHVIAISQMLTSALLIHLCGGRIETHFHVFGSLALLACYRDWRVLLSATCVVATDHIVRGFYFPQSVFGTLTASPWQVLEHLGWVVFENVFLVIAIRQSSQEMKNASQKQAELVGMNQRVQAANAELVMASQTIDQARGAAEEANNAKNRFMANMSHELRTPLNSMLILAQCLAGNAEENLTPDQIKSANIIHSGGQELLMLIGDILDLTKVESGQLEPYITPIDVSALANRIYHQFAPIAKQKGVVLENILADGLPKGLMTDSQKVEQVLRNLVSNAIKFTKSGTVTFHIGRPRKNTRFEDSLLTPETAIAFTVTDSGIGIPEDKQEKIFESFHQADGSISRQYGGTGLGLSVSRKLSTLLEGEIQVQSRVGEGSTFTFFLPWEANQKISNDRIETKKGKPELATGDISTIPSLPGRDMLSENRVERRVENSRRLVGKRVLFVDDDHRNLYAICAALKEAGIDVVTAENGKIGLEMLESHEVDLVLMDIMMPVMDGYEAIRCIRMNEDIAHLPIIALTAKAMPEDREHCFEAGANDYLSKPVDVNLLMTLISVWIFQKPAVVRN